MIGQTLLHYRITDRLGAGGMGEVYLARDEKLNRDVALKVLPEAALSNEEARQRFRREADALAQLSHPHIATLHDFDSADGTDFLVMELVRGPSLRVEIGQKGALPEETVVRLGAQMARGLQAAHERGIVHRDLKPSNLHLTPDGLLKILDFGLARLLSSQTGPAGKTAVTQTAIGKVAGTLAYMSPEQLRGRGVDARTDLYAAGAVLYEMATAQPLFSKPSAAELTEAILNEGPRTPRELNERISPGLEALILKALDKDPELRYQTAKDLRADLERLQRRPDPHISGTAPLVPRPADATAERDRETKERRRVPERILWTAALTLAAVAAFVVGRELPAPTESPPVVRFALNVPEELPLRNLHLAVSRDGRRVAIVPIDPVAARVWVRPLDARHARAIPGTEGATASIWSPDGAAIAFPVVDTGQGEVTLKRVDLATGLVRPVCSVPGGTSLAGSWSRDDVIVFSAGSGQTRIRVYAVPASGGQPREVLQPDAAAGELSYANVDLLPDGNRFLFGILSNGWKPRGVWLSSLDAPSERTPLLSGTVFARYAAGHLLHVRDGVLLAQAFDLGAGELTGEPFAVASSVAIDPRVPLVNGGLFAVSPRGDLVYAEQGNVGRELAWLDRAGERLGTLGPPDEYEEIQLSPDDQRVVATIERRDAATDLWTLGISRGVATRVTSHPGADQDAVWSPDGRQLFFSSDRDGNGAMRLHRKRLGASEPASLLADATVNTWAEGVSPDGRWLVYHADPNQAIWAMPLDGSGEPELLVKGDYTFDETQVSPDGHWLAYGAQETGEWEVYIIPFRRVGERIRVSTAGGVQPRWRGDSRELFYVAPEGQLMAVDIQVSGDRLEPGLPQVLFDAGVFSPWSDEYGVSRDGQRFVVITPVKEAGWSLQVILNWPGLLP
jgi:Tol biopolymer transport system component/tRNA A-37 threonylcarbamoyl transferase component Bud32